MAARKKKTAHRAHKRNLPKPANDEDEGESHGRGPRPAWQGHLRLSLVSCPVALFNATTHSSDVSFHLLNPKTQNRVRMIPTDPDTGPIERSKLVKGYEISKNHYVLVSNEELGQVKLETTRTLDIERFVDADTIDRMFWNDPYYLVPDGRINIEAYMVIRDAMAASGRIALGRVVMHTRERLMAIEPRDKGLVAYTLRMRDEVQEPKKFFSDIPSVKPEKQMLEIAEKIINQQEGPFEPSDFKDRYEAALRDLIRRKQKGQKIAVAEPPEDTNVIDLMAALKKSLGGKAAHASTGKRKRAH